MTGKSKSFTNEYWDQNRSFKSFFRQVDFMETAANFIKSDVAESVSSVKNAWVKISETE